jgi:predicted restriction endonuclease
MQTPFSKDMALMRYIMLEVGQQQLRELLLQKYSACQICGLDYSEMLIASHIVPWSDDQLDEIVEAIGENSRGNLNNVLLLCANHDKLFDRHLMSFADDGRIVISDLIRESDYGFLQIRADFMLPMGDEQKVFMAEHQKGLRGQ